LFSLFSAYGLGIPDNSELLRPGFRANAEIKNWVPIPIFFFMPVDGFTLVINNCELPPNPKLRSYFKG
jgi:hypothetical protein